MKNLEKELKKYSDKDKSANLQRFFKTGKGEYGEGDVFLGISVPQQRKIARQFFHLELNELQNLLNSKIHEKRMIALLILIDKNKKACKKADEKLKKQVFDFYLKNTKNINSWDLVDLSAPNIMGNFLMEKDKRILYKLAVSKSLWERRIAIISTFCFIKNNKFEDTLRISEILLKDSHDLIHKSVGWMLREVGNRNKDAEEKFLKMHYKEIPRTMLRYAIEKFPENKRRFYLEK